MSNPTRISRAQWTLAFLIVSLLLGKLAYSLLVRGQLRQTAALFIGLPAFLALILALTPRAQTITGMVLKGTTIALLASGIFLEEGFICILLAAPLFYAVALFIGIVLDRARGRPDQRKVYGLLLAPALLMSLEGVHPLTSFPRQESVTVERILQAAPEEEAAALAETPRFDHPLPGFFRLGFPQPVMAAGEGLGVGASRRVDFAVGEATATLSLRVAERGPGRVRFAFTGDSTPIADWLRWESSEVTWEALGDNRTRVRWTLRYHRLLDPAWYFSPLERHGVRLAAGYLIDALATP